MLELLLNTALIVSLLLYIPMFLSVMLIIKHFTKRNFKTQYAYKLLLFNGFMHSLYLVLYLFYPQALIPLIIVSFFMVPTYVLLLLRQINFRIQASTRLKVLKDVSKETGVKKRLTARLKREKLRVEAQAKWK